MIAKKDEIKKLQNEIFDINYCEEFNEISLKIFQYQADNNPVYSNFLQQLKIKKEDIKNIKEIPFLPIEFFKTQKVICQNESVDIIFESSGTTSLQKSLHYIADVALYEKSFINCFTLFYGNPYNYNILALLPSYLENNSSSLIYMIDKLIKLSHSPYSGFFLHNTDDLYNTLKKLQNDDKTTILFGVSYALLDFAEKYKPDLHNMIVMETGGMKGRKKELIRKELHYLLCSYFKVSKIHSEYGMTELNSQAYSKGDEIFSCPPWMRMFIRDPDDPLSELKDNGQGVLNIIDLANIYSCSFIATQDLCEIITDNNFKILGRTDSSEIRGCNQLII